MCCFVLLGLIKPDKYVYFFEIQNQECMFMRYKFYRYTKLLCITFAVSKYWYLLVAVGYYLYSLIYMPHFSCSSVLYAHKTVYKLMCC